MTVKTFISLVALNLVCYQFNTVYSLNILGIFPFEGKTHFKVFETYLRELASRGHNVTVISHFPQEEVLSNYNDIHLSVEIESLENAFPIQLSYVNIIQMSFYLISSGNENCRQLLGNKKVQNLWKSESKFDVVIVEQFNSDCALGLAHRLGAPVVGVTSHMLLPWHYSRFGIPYNPSYVPFLFLLSDPQTSIIHRIERSLFDMYFNFAYKYFGHKNDQATLQLYFDNVPPLDELAREIKFLLIYQNFVLTGSKIMPPNVIEVGGYHVPEAKKLPNDLQTFIDEAEHGVIYVSFGSLITIDSFPKVQLDIIINVLSELPQRIIWKWNEDYKPGKPSKFYLAKWLPQNDILAHPNVVAFYSHGGMLGTTEAVHNGVPVLAMPAFGDQPANAVAIEEKQLGVQIFFSELTKKTLLQKFDTILDPMFRKRVKTLSQAWKERPTSAMDSAVFWTEFAARYKNLTFRSAAADVPLYQYLCLDIVLIIVCAVIGVVFVTKVIIMYIFKSKPRKTTKTD